MCRNDPTIKKIVKMQWNKDRAKVDKTDEVRNLAKLLYQLLIQFKKQLECVDETAEASLMFDSMHWASLSEAISLCHEKRQWRQCKVRIEKHDGLPAHELSGHTTLTDTESTRAADELADFKKVLKHHENIVFAGAKYLMNKSRQERLYLPTRIPAEENFQKLRNFTVSVIRELSECDGFELLYHNIMIL